MSINVAKLNNKKFGSGTKKNIMWSDAKKTNNSRQILIPYIIFRTKLKHIQINFKKNTKKFKLNFS